MFVTSVHTMGASQGTPKNIQEVSSEDVEFLCKNTDMKEDQARESFTKFMKDNPEGIITRESFREMMKICYTGKENRNLEKHIFRKILTNS